MAKLNSRKTERFQTTKITPDVSKEVEKRPPAAAKHRPRPEITIRHHSLLIREFCTSVETLRFLSRVLEIHFRNSFFEHQNRIRFPFDDLSPLQINQRSDSVDLECRDSKWTKPEQNSAQKRWTGSIRNGAVDGSYRLRRRSGDV